MADFVRIKIDDFMTKEGRDFESRVISLVRRSVHVGFFSDRHYIKENGQDVDFVKVAARHEFGTINKRTAKKYNLGESDLMPNPRMDISAEIISEEKGDRIAELGAEYLDGKAPLMGILDTIGKMARDVMRSIFKHNPTFSPRTDSEYRKEVDKGFRTFVEYEIKDK